MQSTPIANYQDIIAHVYAPAPAPVTPQRSSHQCRRCGRPLSNPRSVRAGIGPVCAGHAHDRGHPAPTSDLFNLPFDPVSRDIICERDPADEFVKRFNIPHRFVYHSPTGMEWGYPGSGPADFALNILVLFVAPAPDAGPMPGRYAPSDVWESWQSRVDRCVSLWDGSVVHADVWEFHQAFKREFVARLPQQGGTIRGSEIRDWLTAQRIERMRLEVAS